MEGWMDFLGITVIRKRQLALIKTVVSVVLILIPYQRDLLVDDIRLLLILV